MRAQEFTTYINAAFDPSVDRNFDRLAQSATKAYSTVERAAASASRAAAGLVGGRGSAGLGTGGPRQAQQQAAATRTVAQANAEVATQANRAASATRAQGNDAARAARQNQGLARSLQTTATALNVVQGPLGPLAGRVSAIGRAISELTGARLGLAGAGAALFAFARTANTFAETEGRLRPLYNTQREVNRAFADVVGIAQRARASLDPVVDLYVRLNSVAGDFGINQDRISKVVEIASKAATLSGGSTQAREAALLQFGQGIGGDFKGAGQEINSIKEQAFALAQAIAHGFENADGSIGTTIGKLKELGAAGELSTAKVVAALERSAPEIEAKFARLPRTLSTSMKEFGNSWTVIIGQSDQAIGLTSRLASLLSIVAQNLRYVAALAIGMGVAFATVKLGRMAGEVIQVRNGIREMNLASQAYWRTEATNAGAAKAAARQRHTALRAERAAIMAKIPALEAEAAAAKQAASARNLRMSVGPVEERRIIQASTIATRELTAARRLLVTVNGEIVRTTATMTAAHRAQAEAMLMARNMSTGLAGAQAALGTVVRGVTMLLTSWNFWLTAIIATMFLVGTRTTSTQKILQGLTDSQREAIDKTLGLASANDELSESYRRLAREMAAKDVREARREFVQNTDELVGRVDALKSGLVNERSVVPAGLTDAQRKARAARIKADEAELDQLARGLESGGVNVVTAYARINDIIARSPVLKAQNARSSSAFFGLAGEEGPRSERLLDNVRANIAATEKYQKALAEQRRVEKEITEQRKPGGGAPRVVTASQLQAQAIATAADQGSNTIRAAGARRRDALATLNQEMGVKGGKVPADKIAEYRQRSVAIEEQYNTEVEGIRAAAKAKTQAAAEARKGARQAEQIRQRDARDDAEDRLSTALIALEQRKAQMTQAEYMAERVRLLTVYDQEVEKITATSAASNKAAAQMIADVRAVAAAAAKAGERRTDILGQYSDDPKAVVRARDQIDDLQRFVDTAVTGVAFIGKTKDEIEEIKRINPLGTGIYTRAMADADAARINQGVRKPFEDIIRDHEREREIQMLLLQGRDIEAEALRRKHTLLDQIGELSDAEYAKLVQMSAEEERINTLLERREKIAGLLRGVVDDVKQETATFLNELPRKGLAAGGNLAKNLLERFQQISIERTVEKFFAGADDKVKSLLSSRHAVESATRQFASDIGSAADSTVTLGSAARTTAETMVQAANDIQTGVAQALAGGGSTTAPSTPAGVAASIATAVTTQLARPTVKAGARLGTGIGASVIAAALPGAVITDNLRTAAQQNAYIRRGLTNVPASRDPHVISQDAYDIRLPKGMSFADAARALKQVAPTFGAELAHAFDETSKGGTGPHGHFVIRALETATQAIRVGSSTSRMAELGATVSSLGSSSGGIWAGIGSLAAGIADVAGEGGGQKDSTRIKELAEAINSPEMEARRASEAQKLPSTREIYNAAFAQAGGKLDDIFNSGSFFKKIGGSVGTALEGSSQGQMASGIARSLGIKQSRTGAAIGGAVGATAAQAFGLPPEVGGFIGGLWGGTIGGALKKAKTGSASISVDAFGNVGAGETYGSSKERKKAASAMADSIGGTLQQIAEQLGASVGSFGSISIGMRDDTYRVDPTGKGNTKTKKGAVKFDTEQEAIAYAIELAISRGAIQGISAASQKILQSGQDLQKALEKAVLIESVPKRLMQRLDPVRFAVSELNDEFVRLINALKEGGGTAEQFADAQKLYELERADAIEQAMSQASSAIDDFLKEMLGGSSSPLNKRTVYENSQGELNKFVSDINSGKLVDQNDLLAAARNFQDASRELNGSSQSFFTDFDYIFDLLSKARSNIGVTNVTDLPPSPFATDKAVQDAITVAGGNTVGAINNQSTFLGGLIIELISKVEALGGGGGGSGSTIDALPSFGRRSLSEAAPYL